MSNKTIAQLDAKTPANTDLIPVADPVTGIAGKASVAQVYDTQLKTPLALTSTGYTIRQGFIVTPRASTQIDGTVSAPTGVAVDLFVITNVPLTSLSSSNLCGADKQFNLSTLPALTSISFPNLEYVGIFPTGNNTFVLNGLPLLTSMSFPKLSIINGGFTWSNLPLITAISFPELKHVQGSFSIGSSATITFSVPKLVYCVSFGPSNLASCTSIDISSLYIAVNSFVVTSFNVLPSLAIPNLVFAGSFQVSSCPLLTTLSAPLLVNVTQGSFTLNSLGSLTSLNLSSLANVGITTDGTSYGAFTVSSCGSLTSISLPAIARIGSFSGTSVTLTSGTAALTSFTLGSTLKLVAGNVTITSAALDQASVDNILVRLAALDGTNGTTAYSSKTVTITGTSATPSATGLAAKATLVARGCTVTHN